ncbi:zinc finger protein, putative [Plasmodium malariae]|uniref:Zinc finger protein, putative n=1 Tax=Plasmodium malariae TaxID=5858 RepID=A0A1D3SMF3_PLAMA|nr:zinc finger protein, putative [Plasmodium malariae]SCO93024.1 zinc finger protein, putative [Plasmodium malariae]
MENNLNEKQGEKCGEREKDLINDTIEVRSLCINCEKEGINKIVKIEIPYFKNTLIHSFECEFCNYRNNVIQDLNTIKEKGIKIIFKITKKEHLDRQLIKSEYGVFKIPEIDFEIPKETQKGSINTIEGFIQTSLNNLSDYVKNLKDMYNRVNKISEDTLNEEKGGEVQKNGNGENIEHIEIPKKTPTKEENNEARNAAKDHTNEQLKGKDNENTDDEKGSRGYIKDERSSSANEKYQQITIENYIKMIESTIHKLSLFIISKELPFTVEIVDPSGLSSLEHYDEDVNTNVVTVQHYERNKEELNELGFYEEDFEEKRIVDEKKEVDEKSQVYENRQTDEKEDHGGTNSNTKEIKVKDDGNNIKKENFDFIKKYVHMHNDTGNTCMKYKNISDEEEGKLIESFTSNCPCCNYLGVNNFCEISIPGFKKCLILSYVCANCNFKTSEIKSSGEINPRGKKIILTVRNKCDLNRFVIKSETASIHIPIVDLTSEYGTLGGTLTTVEGLIIKIIESLEDKFKFLLGDSNINTHNHENGNEKKSMNITINSDASFTHKIKNLISNLYKLCKTEELCPYDLIIDDIASNSYISSDKIDEDENLKEEEYERTYEQNDMLGLTSMVTENY